MMKKIKSKFIYIVNISLWMFFKYFHMRNNIKNDTILIIPPDSQTVWGSRGDEAMLEVIIKNYKQKGIINFTIFVSSHATITDTEHKDCKYYNKWYSHFPILGFLKALNDIKPCEVVIIGADCMDGYYSTLSTLTRLICIDLCDKYAIPYNIIGFSFNQYPDKRLLLPYKLVSKNITFKLRDPISLKRFNKFTNCKSQQVADSAFLLKPDGKCEDITSIEKKIKILKHTDKKFIVGFNFHPMLLKNTTEHELNRVARIISDELIEILASHPNILLVIVPHDNRGSVSDCNILKLIAENIKKELPSERVIYIDKVYHARQIKYIAGLLDMLICSRMHLAIAALGMGVPVMTANYQGKFAGLFELFHLPNKYILELDELCSHTLIERFDEFYRDYEKIRNLVNLNKDTVIELSSNNFNKNS